MYSLRLVSLRDPLNLWKFNEIPFILIYAKYRIFSNQSIFLKRLQKHPSYALNKLLHELIEIIHVNSKFTFIQIVFVNKVDCKKQISYLGNARTL